MWTYPSTMWTFPLLYGLSRCLYEVVTYFSFSTRNVAFTRFSVQMIKLRAQFLDYQIKAIRLGNTNEFTSQTFTDYCMSVIINIEHPVTHTHTKNSLAKSFITCLQLIARSLLMETKLFTSTWGHTIMHAAGLVRI